MTRRYLRRSREASAQADRRVLEILQQGPASLAMLCVQAKPDVDPRRVDRALQRLRKAGKIRFVRDRGIPIWRLAK